MDEFVHALMGLALDFPDAPHIRGFLEVACTKQFSPLAFLMSIPQCTQDAFRLTLVAMMRSGILELDDNELVRPRVSWKLDKTDLRLMRLYLYKRKTRSGAHVVVERDASMEAARNKLCTASQVTYRMIADVMEELNHTPTPVKSPLASAAALDDFELVNIQEALDRSKVDQEQLEIQRYHASCMKKMSF